jgi:signal peptidase II
LRASGQAPAWLLWTLAGAVFLLDWLSKRWVLEALAAAPTRHVLGDFLRFSYVRNPGVAFGFFADRGFPLTWVSAVALVAVLWLAFRPTARRWLHAAALGLILGGALGNLFDRLRRGSVVDFIDIGVGSLRWWVFNVADAAITVGVLLWAGEILFGHVRTGDRHAENEIPAAGELAARPLPGAPGGSGDDGRGA